MAKTPFKNHPEPARSAFSRARSRPLAAVATDAPPLPIRRTSGIHFICLVENDKSLPRGVRVAIQIIELRPPAISALHLLEKWA